jgi:hypothetical protein
MSYGSTPPPVTANLQVWAQNLVNYLQRVASRLQFKPASASAADDGVILWDAAGGYPVVSKGGEWRELVMADGHAIFAQDANITAAAANTAYAIQFDTPSLAKNISLSGTNPTRIVFADGGLYRVSFTAQIASSSASTIEFRFWPRVNGTNVGGSTMVASLHNNGATIVVSRDAIFQFSAGDYLEAMWATDSTSGILEAHVATAYAPASPSATMAISRVSA